MQSDQGLQCLLTDPFKSHIILVTRVNFDQTAQMIRLIWVKAGQIYCFLSTDWIYCGILLRHKDLFLAYVAVLLTNSDLKYHSTTLNHCFKYILSAENKNNLLP